jgi:predicted ATPase
LRQEEIKLQVALITPLVHLKGYAAPETKMAVQRAHHLIEQAKLLGEPPEDPLLLFSVLYGFWAANYIAFNGNVCGDLASQFLALAEKQGATAPLIVGHRLTATSLLCMGDIVKSQAHYDQALALYDPAVHRALATRFGVDLAVLVLSHRTWAMWVLGYPEAARTDLDRALNYAREIGQAATLLFALAVTTMIYIYCGNYAAAKAQADDVVALADQKSAQHWKALGILNQGCVQALTGKTSDAVQMITSALAAWRSTGATVWIPWYLSNLASAHADLDQFDDAWRCITEAMTAIKTTKEQWCEAEVCRIAGEIALMPYTPDATAAEVHFERALAIARQQQAKSWELRAAMSLARVWRSQGKMQQARELLASVYGWFTEGFDTRDLKEAKLLLEELAA